MNESTLPLMPGMNESTLPLWQSKARL